MGDRTYVEVTIAACDFERVKEIFLRSSFRSSPRLEFEGVHEDNTAYVGDYGVSYHGLLEACAMRRAGIPFILQHGGGSICPSGVIIFDGEHLNDTRTIKGQIALLFDEERGHFDEEQVRLAKEFCEMRSKVLEIIRSRASVSRPHRSLTETASCVHSREGERAD